MDAAGENMPMHGQLVEKEVVEPEVCSDASNPHVFRIDRHKIQTVKQGPEELEALGITIYDQDTFEKGILDQVDEAIERQNKQIEDDTSEPLGVESENVPNVDAILHSENSNEDSGKKENFQQGISSKTENNKARKNNSLLFHALKHGSKETDYERKIRLGEMTPFGSVVDRKDIRHDDSLSHLNDYFEKQINLQHEYKCQISKQKGKSKKTELLAVSEQKEEKCLSKKKSPLKKSILLPAKRRKKEELGTRIGVPGAALGSPGKLLSEITPLENSDDDTFDDCLDSDYKPDSEEDEMKLKKKRAKQKLSPAKMRKTKGKLQAPPEDWGTDDSDWESSDDETQIRRRKSSKKEIDDGNFKDYEYRLKCWEISKENDTLGDHCLSGGYKLPKSFQKVGVQWLWELHQQGCGGILGDEMGLGKTVQIISFLAGLSHSRLMSRHKGFRGLGPTLIVCPTTVLHQWVSEFHTWWPPFRVAILHESGSFSGKKDLLIQQISSKGGILITSFTGAVQHCSQLTTKNWHYVILDEGHKIRNPDAQVTLAVKQFRTPHRIILSGSPMQNNLRELWSLFDFVFPGKLGTLPVFIAQFAVPITQGGYSNASEVQVATAFKCATVLRDTISPYLLRRIKSDVKTHIQLPAKNEQVLFCKLTEEQRDLYRTYLDSGEEKEEDLPEEQRYGYWKKSGKMIVVESLLKIWKKQGHKVLLFTQSRQMLCVLEAFVQKEGYSYLKLDGGTSVAARQPLINKFNQDPSYFVFLLTTRVGGLGVNLTGANRVLIFDPDWNPATDTQARERAWRIGQQNQIYHRQIFKQFLTNKVLSDPKQRRFFKSNDLFELFTLKEGDQEGSTETSAIFAGTGSEVKLKKLKEKIKEKKRKEIHVRMKIDAAKVHNPSQDSIKFSKAQIERMKKLSKKIAQGISKTKASEKEMNSSGQEFKKLSTVENGSKTIFKTNINSEVATVTSRDLEVTKAAHDVVEYLLTEVVKNIQCSDENGGRQSDQSIIGEDSLSLIPEDSLKSCGTSNTFQLLKNPINFTDHKKEKLETNNSDHSRKKKHKHKKSKKRKEVYFEGEEVPHLVGMEQSKQSTEKDVNEIHAAQDDYVLQKLFKKSGLQTVLKHDKIMEGGPADHALVEGEARRVAKEALQALRRSRQQCFAAETGRPSWTGQSGVLRLPGRPRFSQKKCKPGSQIENNDHQKPMSSSDLLARMRQRRVLAESTSNNEEEQEEIAVVTAEVPEPSTPSLILSNPVDSEANVDLLRDIRNFVAFGAITDGRASTNEIIEKFRDRLPPSSTPIFKFLLEEICDFFRMPSGEGMWKLRPEFQW
ncbi:ATP-dependent helicase brm [Gryllus bimaculatus]|nr:ATP-dependent helicase brm [Gryllus bimaculatus]